MEKGTLFIRVIDEHDPKKGLGLKREMIDTKSFFEKHLGLSKSPSLGEDYKITRIYLDLSIANCNLTVFELEGEGKSRLFPCFFEEEETAVLTVEQNEDKKDGSKYLFVEQSVLFSSGVTLPRLIEKNKKQPKGVEELGRVRGVSRRHFYKSADGAIKVVKVEKKQEKQNDKAQVMSLSEIRNKYLTGELQDPLFAYACLMRLMKDHPEMFTKNEEVVIHP